MLFLHAAAGPYPLLPLFGRLGVRTRDEIDKEKYALKAMRGDFADVTGDNCPCEIGLAGRSALNHGRGAQEKYDGLSPGE
jgi:hypothetical protein